MKRMLIGGVVVLSCVLALEHVGFGPKYAATPTPASLPCTPKTSETPCCPQAKTLTTTSTAEREKPILPLFLLRTTKGRRPNGTDLG